MPYEIKKVDYSATSQHEEISFVAGEELTVLVSPDGRAFVLDMECDSPDGQPQPEGWKLEKVINQITRKAVLNTIRCEVEDFLGNTYTELGGKEVIEQV